MPWTVAGFLGMVWFLPFDAIELPVHLRSTRSSTVCCSSSPGRSGRTACSRPPSTCARGSGSGRPHLAVRRIPLVATVGTVLNATVLAASGELGLSMKKLGCSCRSLLLRGRGLGRPTQRGAPVRGADARTRKRRRGRDDLRVPVPLQPVLRVGRKPVRSSACAASSDLDQRDSDRPDERLRAGRSPIENATMPLALPFALIGVPRLDAQTAGRVLGRRRPAGCRSDVDTHARPACIASVAGLARAPCLSTPRAVAAS